MSLLYDESCPALKPAVQNPRVARPPPGTRQGRYPKLTRPFETVTVLHMNHSISLLVLLLLAACSDDPTRTNDVSPGDATLPDSTSDVSADISPDSVADADTTADLSPDTTADVSPDTTADVSPDTTADTSLDSTDASNPGTTYALSLGTWTMNPAEETTRCVVKRLGNQNTLRVSRITTELARGSHHFIVYKSPDTVEQTTPFPCTPFTETLGGSTVPLMISQTRNETLTLPEGVAFELPANQMIRLEAHFLNYFPDPIETGAEVTFEEAPPTATTLADFMFYGTTQVFIPAGQSVTTPWKFHSVPSGLNVFGLTGHTHALGTNVEIQKSPARTSAGTSVYPPPGQPFDWAEAPVAYFTPPLAFTGDGFRFRCSWNNTTDSAVTFGESANNEMCFFWAYYYPAQGFIVRF